MDLDQHQLWQRIIFIVIMYQVQVRSFYLNSLFHNLNFVETRRLRSIPSDDEPLLGSNNSIDQKSIPYPAVHSGKQTYF